MSDADVSSLGSFHRPLYPLLLSRLREDRFLFMYYFVLLSGRAVSALEIKSAARPTSLPGVDAFMKDLPPEPAPCW